MSVRLNDRDEQNLHVLEDAKKLTRHTLQKVRNERSAKMHDNTEFIKKKKEENAIAWAEESKNNSESAVAKIEYNIMMGNLEDPLEETNE